MVIFMGDLGGILGEGQSFLQQAFLQGRLANR
jgi:hypothetical protein